MKNRKKLKLELRSQKELQEQYPKCFKPLLKVQSVQFPPKRTSLADWLTKIYNYERPSLL